MTHTNSFFTQYWPAILAVVALIGIFIWIEFGSRIRHYFRSKVRQEND